MEINDAKLQENTLELDERTPDTLRELSIIFPAIDFTLTSLSLYHRQNADFKTLQTAIQSFCDIPLTIRHIQTIMYLFPDAYIITPIYNTTANRENSEGFRISRTRVNETSNLNTRLSIFYEKINAYVRSKCGILIASNAKLSSSKLQSLLNELVLPAPPLFNKNTSLDIQKQNIMLAAQHLQRPKQNNGITNTKLNSNQFENDVKLQHMNAPIRQELQTLPAWLIEKVRRAELESHISKTKIETLTFEENVAALTDVADQLESYALVKRKSVFPILDLLSTMQGKETFKQLQNQIYALETLVPFWLSVIESGGKEYVKLNRKSHKYNSVKVNLRKMLKETLENPSQQALTYNKK